MRYLGIILVFVTISCSDSEISKIIEETRQKAYDSSLDLLDSINQKGYLEFLYNEAESSFPLVNYDLILIEDNAHRNKLMNEYRDTKENFAKNKAFVTLNRKERRYMRVGEKVLVPDSAIEDMRAYSVFPQYYHGASNIPKLIVISNMYQSYACYEYGKQVRFAAANTGKEKTQTYPGRYSLVWKAKMRISSLNSEWELPFTWNFHRYAGNAFHQFTMPGYPASHSCVRQFMDDAEWLFHWGDKAKWEDVTFIPHSGTPVIIIDAFDYSLKKSEFPWLHIASNKSFKVELPEKPLEMEEAYIPLSQIPEEVRNMLPDKDRYKFAEDTLRARGVIRKEVAITPSINFNKLRKEKAAKKAKKLAEQKKIEQIEKDKLNMQLIKENLEELNSEPR